jgi:transcriptional regulator with XRE-family HTH domain
MRKQTFLENFGQLVARRRRAEGMTQEALAAKAGVHRTYVGDIENGRKSPTLTTAWSLAAALGETLSDLIRTAESGTPS